MGGEPVSNPHRYGQKQAWDLTILSDGTGFQTLIGTVKRVNWEPFGTAAPPAFQTLIGTVKSLYTPALALATDPFQTLIGTVKSILPAVPLPLPGRSFKPS